MARAFAITFDDEDTFEEAWYGGEPVEHRVTVTTREGDVEVVLGAPVEGVDATRLAPDEPPERIYRLKIELEEIDGDEPDGEVSRTVEMAGDATLHDLHDVIRQAFGWDDDHLYEFYVSGKLRDWDTYYVGSPDGDEEPFFDLDGGSRAP